MNTTAAPSTSKIVQADTRQSKPRSRTPFGVPDGIHAALLRQGRIHRVIAVFRGRVMVEIALGNLRVQTMLKVPADQMPGFLLHCERQGGPEEADAGPGPMAESRMLHRPFHRDAHPRLSPHPRQGCRTIAG